MGRDVVTAEERAAAALERLADAAERVTTSAGVLELLAELRQRLARGPAVGRLQSRLMTWSVATSRAAGCQSPRAEYAVTAAARLVDGWLWPVPPLTLAELQQEAAVLRAKVAGFDPDRHPWADDYPPRVKGRTCRWRAWLERARVVPPAEQLTLPFDAPPES